MKRTVALSASVLLVAVALASLAISALQAESSAREAGRSPLAGPGGADANPRGEEGPESPGRGGRDARPNIVVIMVDDQAHNTFSRKVQPRTFRHLLDDGGTAFPRAAAVPPLCCPARAGFQTGQYPHNHGVTSNNYKLLRDPENVLSAWLKRAGYETGFVGKYMNKYELVRGTRPAPGWDYWWAADGRPDYFDARISDEGEPYTEKRYLTSATTDRAIEFLRQAQRRRPYFLWLSYYAPHVGRDRSQAACPRSAPQVLGRDWRAVRDTRLPRPLSYDERDVADKPAEVRVLPRLDRKARFRIRRNLLCTKAAMRAVDRGVARVVREIKRRGEWERTVIVYLSDNGYFFGEHRIPTGKSRPYREAVEVPFVIRAPKRVLGAAPPKRTAALVTNIDLAPTFLELAGAEPCIGPGRCRILDGISLLALLRGEDDLRDRAILLELGPERCRRYDGVWTAKANYTEWFAEGQGGRCRTTDLEYYDRTRDPHQLHNLLSRRRAVRGARVVPGSSELRRLLGELRGCAGVAGRDQTERPCA